MVSVKLIELKKIIDEMLLRSADFVEITVIEGEMFNGEYLPTTLHLSMYDGYGGAVDWDPIENIEVDAFYKYQH